MRLTELPPDGGRLLERAALALVEALEAPGCGEAPPDVRRRAEALHAAVATAHPVSADLQPADAAEHAELAEAAAAALSAVVAWATTGVDDHHRPGRRRTAVAAARTLHDDLRVHHAHERDR